MASSLLRYLVVGVAVIALGITGWSWWHSDARRIGRELDRLMAQVDKSPGENPLTGALAAQEAAGQFAQSFHFRARQFDFETRDRQSLIRAIALYRNRSERIATQVLDEQLDIDAAAGRATMVLTARFQGGWQALTEDGYRFQLDWVEEEGGWRIAYADLLEVVQPVAERFLEGQ